MADSAPAGPDGNDRQGAPHRRGALSTLFNGGVTGLNALGSAWIFLLMLLINCDAIGRTFFNHPVEGVIEIIELSIVGIVFLQIADATRAGRLTRSDGLLNVILGRRPPTGRAMGAPWEGISILFMGIVLWGSVVLLIGSYRNNEYVGADGVFTFPEWPVKVVIAIGCATTLLQFCVFLYRFLRTRPTSTEDVVRAQGES
jgi:TRAP-type C4-dicarboxylate transport system permease small subunit